MGNALENAGVTRPTSFDPRKGYKTVLARGDEVLADYDLIDLQRIQQYDEAIFRRTLLREGAVLYQAGGTIGQPTPGVNIGADSLGSAGKYIGLESLVYTIKITTGGPAGTATFAWRSSGSDRPEVSETPYPITAIAPSLAAAQADPATYGHAVGFLGLVLYFVNANGFVTGGNSWTVSVTYGDNAPIVAGDTLTIADLIIPVAGAMLRVAGATLTYPHLTTGISAVYVEFTRTLVDHVADPGLIDPLSGHPAAYREAWTATLRTTDTSNDPPGPTELERRVFAVYQWDRASDLVQPLIPNVYAINVGKTEGALDAERLANVDQNETFRGVLAELDTDAHGSYVFRPLRPEPRATISGNVASPGKLRLAVPPIGARVEGVLVTFPTATELEVDQALETGSIHDEPFTYTAAADPFPLTKASLYPIAATIPKLTATVQVGTGTGGSGSGYEAVTRGAGAYDALSKNPVTALVTISSAQGGGGTVYVQGTNYDLQTESGLKKVHWITGAPSGGATYYVCYQYQKTMVQATDFELTGAGAITFATLAGDNPVEGTQPQVDYNYYLPRHDLIILRPNSTLAVLRGIPAEDPQPPPLPRFALPYAVVQVAPNSGQAVIVAHGNERWTYEQLGELADIVFQLQRNVAQQELLNQARARLGGLATASFVDTFAEDFSTLRYADEAFNVGGQAYEGTIDTEAGEFTLPFLQALPALTKIAAPAGETDARVGEQFWTLPFADELAIASDKWSRARPVNAYTDFRVPPPLVRLGPSQDFFNDTTVTTSSQTRVIQNATRRSRTPARRVPVLTVGGVDIMTQATEVAALRMRQLQVAVAGFHFVPLEKVRVRFAGKAVPFLADAPSVQVPAGLGNGATDAVYANNVGIANTVGGEVNGHFVVPSDTPAGTVAVECWGDQGVPNAVWPADYTLRASVPFSSVGTVRQVAVEIVTTEFPLPIPRRHGRSGGGVMLDPLAQSFLFGVPRMISKVDVPLAAKPTGTQGVPLICEMRATDRSGDASTPAAHVLASRTLEQRDCEVGDASSNVLVWPDPVMCDPFEFRALVLRTPSPDYEVFVAELGGPDRVAGGFITQQQIPDGILMDSVNNADWTSFQGADLRCKVWVAKATAGEAHLYFARLTSGVNGVPADLTALLVNPDQVVPDGTSIDWQYAVDGLALTAPGKVWITFLPHNVTEFAAFTQTLDVRAVLKTTDPYVLPSIARSNGSLHVQANKANGKYISKEVGLTVARTQLDGVVEFVKPSGDADPALFVSLDGGATFTTVGALTVENTDVDGTVRAKFSTGLTSGKRLRLRVDLAAGNKARRPRIKSLTAWPIP